MSISALWAKKSTKGAYWLPLETHLRDTAEISGKLWRKWLPESVKRIIADSTGGDEQEARNLLVFLAAAHDLGKATPVFQAKWTFQNKDLDMEIYNRLLSCGLNVRESRDKYRFYQRTPHALASQLLLEEAKELGLSDTNLSKNAAIIIGAHHGKPPDGGYSKVLNAYQASFGHDSNRDGDNWKHVQSELIQLILNLSGYDHLTQVPSPLYPAQVLLSGIIIVSDWIASNERFLPLIPIDWEMETDSATRAQLGWNKLNLPGKWDPYQIRNDFNLYNIRFKNIVEINQMQKAALSVATSLYSPGIMVIEAPMGQGKTEAALVVAEIFRDKTDSNGVFFALPTQATSDGIFPRLIQWMNTLELNERQSVRLAHGKAQYNKDYNELMTFASTTDSIVSNDEFDKGEDNAAYVHEWFNGRKTAMLANFVVGTIDQLLLMALKQKHVMLRHLGLAGKVVIIDECHAYDAYMNHYLKMALTWLGEYGVPVIVLSATLPADKRRELVGAYLGKDNITGDWATKREYPLITYSDGDEIKSCVIGADGIGRDVLLERLEFDAIADKLEELLSEGGCAGVIMDTVHRAQLAASRLRERFGDSTVMLIHSRFIIPDRMEKERVLRDKLGKDCEDRPKKLVVVGTQVLEQSLDIDFDVMITDIAPMDLLLQRIGRLHRHSEHDSNRSAKLCKPMCFITGIVDEEFERGIDRVYDKHLLIRTRDLLNSLDGKVTLPGDIAHLVNDTYDKTIPQTPEKENWEKNLKEKENKAESFRIGAPMKKPNKTIVDWLRTSVDDDEKKGEASVRDSYDSVEVLVVKKTVDGFSKLDGESIPATELDDKNAWELARQSVSLPIELSNMATIDELRKSTNTHGSIWQSSPWITGELFLILDDNGETELCGHKVKYTNMDGLQIEREEV